jgi:predicted MFS family arabinose efflux permease
VLSALVTAAVWRYVPAGTSAPGADRSPASWPRGSGRLLACSALLGLASIAVWTLGRQVITEQGGSPVFSALVWTVLGAAGLVGAVSGPLVARLGIARAWQLGMVVMGAATTTFAVSARVPVVAVVAAFAFGATYIALTGVLLVWATRLFPERVAFGVGSAFLVVAVGQAAGSALAGSGVETFSITTVFIICTATALAGAALAHRL